MCHITNSVEFCTLRNFQSSNDVLYKLTYTALKRKLQRLTYTESAEKNVLTIIIPHIWFSGRQSSRKTHKIHKNVFGKTTIPAKSKIEIELAPN